MQLGLRVGLVAAALLAAPGRPGAHVEGATNLTIFREASNAGNNLQVIHPQGDVSADIGTSFSVAAGYEVDIVSGATPTIFGRTETDAITSATSFSDQRHLARGGLQVETPLVGLSAGYSYGWEKDYRSHTITAAARGDFFERNFTFGLAYTRNFDSVCDQNNEAAQSPLDRQALASAEGCFQPDRTDVVSHRVAVHTFEPSLVWTATPRLLLQLGGTLQVVDGFQASPYRRVLVGSEGRTPQEHLPELRQRWAAFAQGRLAIPAVRAAVSVMTRLYRDTWDVRAATAEAELSKYLMPSIIVAARGRYHAQGSAIFYRKATEYRTLGPVGKYWTGDRELAPMSTMLGGLKLAYLRRREQQQQTVFEELELNVRFDLLSYDLSDGAPNSDRTGAFVAQMGLSVQF